MEPQFIPAPPWAKRWAIEEQLHRTVMCNILPRRGSCCDDCKFAHSAWELRAKPILKKTSICQDWMQGRCSKDSCEYAHGVDDLQQGGFYKTQYSFTRRGDAAKGVVVDMRTGMWSSERRS